MNKFPTIKVGILTNIGNIYYEWEDFENALHIYKEGYDLIEKENITKYIPILGYNIALCYFFKKDYKQCLEYNKIVLSIANEIENDYDIISSLVMNDLVELANNNDYIEFNTKYKTNISKLEKVISIEELIILKEFVSKALFSLDLYDYAQEELEPLYKEVYKNKFYNKADGIRKVLLEIYLNKGDYKSAYLIKEDAKQSDLYNLNTNDKIKILKSYDSLQESVSTWSIEYFLEICKVLSKVGQHIARKDSYKKIYKYVSEHLCDVWNLDFFGVYVQIDSSDQEDYYNYSDKHMKSQNVQHLSESILNELINLNKEIVIHNINNMKTDEELSKELISLIKMNKIKSLIYLPIRSQDRIIAGITIQSQTPDFLGYYDLELLKTISSLLAEALIEQ